MPVMNIEPHEVYLVYNCYYMREICRNAELFALTARGQNLHPQSGMSNTVYTYDLNTGKSPGGQPTSRQEYRRSASCPSSWAATHPCPEPGTRPPMRHDGEWFTSALEPGTTINELLNERNANGIITKYSDIRYTCDEFPPATWYVATRTSRIPPHSRRDNSEKEIKGNAEYVPLMNADSFVFIILIILYIRVEGGNGWGGNDPSNTRCAALACANNGASVVKAEQNCE